MSSVLIETSWNVKTGGAVGAISLASINRNIVECKGTYILYKGLTGLGY